MKRSKKARPGINANQTRLIHMAVRQLGIDDAAYREMLQNVAGVDSSTELDSDGFDKVMAHLRACGFEKHPSRHEFSGFVAYKDKWRNELGERPGMATPGQLAAIEVAWDAMKWFWAPDGFGNRELALRGFLRDRFKTAELRFLTFATAGRVIHALKEIQKRRSTHGVQAVR